MIVGSVYPSLRHANYWHTEGAKLTVPARILRMVQFPTMWHFVASQLAVWICLSKHFTSRKSEFPLIPLQRKRTENVLFLPDSGWQIFCFRHIFHEHAVGSQRALNLTLLLGWRDQGDLAGSCTQVCGDYGFILCLSQRVILGGCRYCDTVTWCIGLTPMLLADTVVTWDCQCGCAAWPCAPVSLYAGGCPAACSTWRSWASCCCCWHVSMCLLASCFKMSLRLFFWYWMGMSTSSEGRWLWMNPSASLLKTVESQDIFF